MKLRTLLIFSILNLIGGRIIGQNDKLTSELKSIVKELESITEGKHNRSAFLDRGMGETLEKYDSLEYEYYTKLIEYLSTTKSIDEIKNNLSKSTEIIEAKNKRIFQWEYIGGGTQEQTNKIIQVLQADSIQIICKEFGENSSRTYGLYYIDNGYLEFNSNKGCRTCCNASISFQGKQIFNIDYRNEFIEQLFSYDNNERKIKIELTDILVEEDNEEFKTINQTIFLTFNGKEFIEQK